MRYKKFKKQHISIAGLVLALALFGLQHFDVITPQPPASSGSYAIDHFTDGDTIAVKMNGTVEAIRFIGVDTPETHKPNSPIQCYGPAAAAFTKRTIGNQRVRLEADPLNTNRDRYNRLLRYVYLPDGTLLNQQLVANGYGFAYLQFPFSKKDTFSEAQDSAQQQRKGLWTNCSPHQENTGRWQTENLSG